MHADKQNINGCELLGVVGVVELISSHNAAGAGR